MVKFYLFILFIASAFSTLAQTSINITTSNGLATNMVSNIIRDRNNYMWVGSYNGLIKHEGSGIKIFKKSLDSATSISGNEMHGLFEDHKGFIWIGTTAGVDKINPVTGKVQNYQLRNPDKKSSFVGYIFAIFQDNKDDIWIVTEVGLFKLNYQTGKYEIIPVTKNEKGILSFEMLYRPSVETTKGLWMCTSAGIMFYDYKTEKFFHRYYNPANNPVFNLPATFTGAGNAEMCADSKGNLYFISSDTMLCCYNPVTNKLDSFNFTYPPDAWKCCLTLCADKLDNIWIGFRHAGILVFNKQTNNFLQIKKLPLNSLLSSNYISSIAKDYRGRMWVTSDNGIDIIDLYNKGVQQIVVSNLPEYENVKYESGITSIDKADNIYIPYFNGGIFTVNANSLTTQYFSPIDTIVKKATFVYVDDNKLWLAANRTLLTKPLLSGKTNFFEKLFPLSDSLKAVRGNAAWVFKASENNYYIKKTSGWWFQVTKNKIEKFEGYGFMKQGCVSKNGESLWYLSPELNIIRRQTINAKSDTFYLQTLLKNIDFNFSNPRDMVDDGLENIWITSQNGLLQYNIKTNSINTFTTVNGLSHNFTHALFADNKHRVWIESLGGIDCYLPAIKKFRNIVSFNSGKYMDGFGSTVSTSDNRICFATGNKIIILNPSLIFADTAKNSILMLHEMRVNNEPVNWKDSTFIMQLPWQKNSLLFRFGLLNFINQYKISYAYKLDDLETDWINIDMRNEIQFDILPAGKYKLHLRAESEDGKFYFNSITFKILPPWWLTWWFKLICFICTLLAVYFLFKTRVKSIRKKAAIKQQITELEAKALRAQMNPHFIFNSLNAIQELIITENTEEGYKYLSSFSKLLRMVLNNSEKNFITLSAELEMIQLYLSLEALRFKQSFKYEILIDEGVETEIIQVPSLLMQPYVENAVWHGLRHKKGDKNLVIIIKENRQQLQIEIDDDGIGREKAGEIKSQKMGAEQFESKGTALAQQRIVLLNLQYPNLATTEIIDKFNEKGEANGTKIIISLPVNIT